MDTVYELNQVARILISLVAIALIVGPAKADFNATHATNPLWTPHARFHVVWQVLHNSCISLVVLYLLWSPSLAYFTHLYLAAVLNYLWGANFVLTIIAMPSFGGSLADVNGIKPFRFRISQREYLVDTNVFGCIILMSLNTAGVFLISAP
ncbi:MAG: DUF6640 family protein [Pseudomonadota bacterium]